MRKRILIMAGGTGGHVFPAIAVADELIKEGWHVRWLGVADRMEATLVPKHGIEIDFIKISGIRGKPFISKLFSPYKIITSILSARRIIKKFHPDIVLGMGGYASGPGGIAAKLCSVPLVIHEQNSVAGLTNKILAKFTKHVLKAYPNSFTKGELVGNPVRQSILNLKEPKQRFNIQKDQINVLIMGGSQGAKVLNDVVPKATKLLTKNFVFWHQTGKNNLNDVTHSYEQNLNAPLSTKNCIVTEFIDDVFDAYNWADVVICRSGALTVSELMAVGLGAIFVPFMHKDKQQYYNAKEMQDLGAAYIIEQPELNAENLAKLLDSLDHQKLFEMAQKAYELAKREVAENVATIIKIIVKNK